MKKPAFVLTFFSIFLFSCVNNIKYNGHFVEKEELAKIKVGGTSKDEVRDIIGSPSVESSYGMDVWYYIQSKSEGYGFMKPVVKERNIVAVGFNNHGKVSEIQTFTLDNGNNVVISSDQTLSQGTKGTVVNHFLKNLGRFNTPSRSKIPGRPKGL